MNSLWCENRDFPLGVPASVLVVQTSLWLETMFVWRPIKLFSSVTLESLSPFLVKGRTVYPGGLEDFLSK